MRIHSLSKEEVFMSLLTSEGGVSEEDARRRLLEYGPNEIREVRGKPLWLRLLAQFTHFLAVLLWIASGLCFLSEHLHPGEGMLSLGLAIIGVILINAAFTFVQEYRAERAVEALKRLLPFNVKVVRGGVTREIPAREVVPGDVILLAEGDKIPTDARLIESHRLMVNNAPLTGESDPKPRGHECFDGEYLESPNIVFAGTLAVSGSGTAVSFATGMSTEFGKIAHLTSGVEAGPSPLQKEIVKATRLVAAIAVGVGLFFFFSGFVIGTSFWSNFVFAIGITVALVPEGLLPTVTLSLAMGSQRMARNRALVKTLTSVETLGAVTVICTDKTGTLTQNRMEVKGVWTPDGDETSVERLMRIAYLCNNAIYEEGQYRGDPTEIALLKKAREVSGEMKADRVLEVPFDSERKRMTTVNVSEGETLILTKGAFETVLPLCSGILRSGEATALSDGARGSLLESYHQMMDEGLRVIAFAMKGAPSDGEGMLRGNEPLGVERREWIESELVFIGLMGLEDPPRPEVPEAVQRCREAGIRVIMITGDAGRTAVAIAQEIGLIGKNPVVVEGAEMDILREGELTQKLLTQEIIFARMTPRHKMRVVSVLKDEGERVAVTGDGVNDAPALKKADIGIAMGMTGTDVAKEAADVILLDDNFATIVNAVEEGRGVFENIRKFITYIFASNIPEAVPYLAYILLPIPLPLTVIQILAVDLGTDMLPALALGAERATPGMMKQPPRKAGKRLLDLPLILRAYLFLGPMEAMACMFGFFWVLANGGWAWGTALPATDVLYKQATTACFAAIVVTQVGNVFACRSARESMLSFGVFSNRLILGGIAFELALASLIIYHPLGKSLFGTAPLGFDTLLMFVPFGFGLVLADEVRKWYARKKLSLS
ncbi:MAG: cation-translocating P-type ATPase [Chloroflexota bacterium]